MKTDLFDEAAAEGLADHLSQPDRVERVVGVDISPGVVASALRRKRVIDAVVGDVRSLPFASGVFDTVVSNSSLDHFESRREIVRAIQQIERITRPGGRVLITLDNLLCPFIALRAVLPFRLLYRLRILRYPVGATLTPRGLRRVMREAGFQIDKTDVFMHVPRVAALLLCDLADRRAPNDHSPAVEHLLKWEFLTRLPTRYLTGHFVGVIASKPREGTAE